MATNKELASKYRAMLHLKVRRGPQGPEARPPQPLVTPYRNRAHFPAGRLAAAACRRVVCRRVALRGAARGRCGQR